MVVSGWDLWLERLLTNEAVLSYVDYWDTDGWFVQPGITLFLNGRGSVLIIQSRLSPVALMGWAASSEELAESLLAEGQHSRKDGMMLSCHCITSQLPVCPNLEPIREVGRQVNSAPRAKNGGSDVAGPEAMSCHPSAAAVASQCLCLILSTGDTRNLIPEYSACKSMHCTLPSKSMCSATEPYGTLMLVAECYWMVNESPWSCMNGGMPWEPDVSCSQQEGNPSA